MNTTELVIRMIIAIIIVVAGIILSGKEVLEQAGNEAVIGICLIVLGCAIAICTMKACYDNSYNKFQNTIDRIEQSLEELQQERELAKQMIEKGANVYIDGVLVDPEKIILDDYYVTIVDDYIILSD